MTAERDGLLRAILEAPDDDSPRLIFADWLEDNGQPERAEFIRIQCGRQMNQPPVCVGPSFDFCRDCYLPRESRAWRLLHRGVAGSRPIFAELPQELLLPVTENLPVSPQSGVFWSRGFVHAVTLSVPLFLRAVSADLFATQPVTSVTLRGAHEPHRFYAPLVAGNDISTLEDPPAGPWGWDRATIDDLATVQSLGADRAATTDDILSLREALARCCYGKLYDTRKQAFQVLSTAVVAWARHRAGLPLLPPV